MNKGIEPYVRCKTTDSDGNSVYMTESDLYNQKIQLNGWKIPKDYPLKF